MTGRDDDFEPRPGRVRDRGGQGRSFAGQVLRAMTKAGGRGPGLGPRRAGGGPRFGRGRAAALQRNLRSASRRVIVKARIVRHAGARFRAAPLARHIAYLEREGVTRDDRRARMFDAGSEEADIDRFAERCQDDRHHFRLIVSPEDAARMADLRAFTRELMADAERDLGTGLDWVAVDHWNTDNPHVHILVRGRSDDGGDLVIDRGYISRGLRDRAEARVTLELGSRNAREIEAALQKDVAAKRWTSLDHSLRTAADDNGGLVDLRPGDAFDRDLRRLLVGRAMTLEGLGLAVPAGAARWTLQPRLEETLRDLAVRDDIIKTLHRAMSQVGHTSDPTRFAMQDEAAHDPVLGRLLARGLQDELRGDAYAVVDGVDGRVHHLRFADLEMTGDAPAGAIVELRVWEDGQGGRRLSLAVRSDLSLEAQITATGATWLDRQLVAREPTETGGGFGAEVRAALARRLDHLIAEGLARRQGQQAAFARDLLETLRRRELKTATDQISKETGLTYGAARSGEHVAGVYRRRLTLASGRFAMIDDGMGFQLVPWRPALEPHLGRHISGVAASQGHIDWSFGRGRGLGR